MSYVRVCLGQKELRGVAVRVLYSLPGRCPAAVVRSGTALDASDLALCASERTQAMRGIERVLAN